MDTRRSAYLAALRDDLQQNCDIDGIANTDIPLATPANDNAAPKDRLSVRCAALVRRLIFLYGWRC